MSRLLIANLDCEVEMAGGPKLPSHVRQLCARSGLGMAVFAEPGDRLWTLEPVEPADDELWGAELVSGPLSEQLPADAILAWGETESIAKLRAQCPAYDGTDPLWKAAPDPAVTRRCNHRRFSFDILCQYDALLPGSAIIAGIDDLESILNDEPVDQWVVKAPLSAAGRDRVRRKGRELDDDARTRIGRLLETHSELYFEPWVDRVADFGVAGVVIDSGARLFPPHRLINNDNGVFRSIEDIDDAPARILDFAAHSGEALADAGYRGAFGIDAFAYRDEHGAERVHPLCEINARLSFGLLSSRAAARTRQGRK